MPDVPYPKETEAKADQFQQAIWGAGGAVGAVTRKIVTGDATGRLRRKVLFLIAALGLWGAADSWVFSLVGLVALLLLAMTDDVVSLADVPDEVPS